MIRDRASGAQGGFTLVEMLVVMSIISILAAILLPVALRARGLARNTQCCSNLGQLSKAVDLYLEAYETWYPCASTLPSTEPSPGLPRICDLLARYASPDVFECPDDRPTDPQYPFGTYFEGEGSSYEWGAMLNYRKQGTALGRPGGKHHPFKLEDVPMFRDYEPFHKRGSRVGVNAVYSDGHAESF